MATNVFRELLVVDVLFTQRRIYAEVVVFHCCFDSIWRRAATEQRARISGPTVEEWTLEQAKGLRRAVDRPEEVRNLLVLAQNAVKIGKDQNSSLLVPPYAFYITIGCIWNTYKDRFIVEKKTVSKTLIGRLTSPLCKRGSGKPVVGSNPSGRIVQR